MPVSIFAGMLKVIKTISNGSEKGPKMQIKALFH